MRSIQDEAATHGVIDPLVPSTDAFVTCICHLGAATLSHVLSWIERCKERLLSIGPQSEAARRQILSSVMDFWKEKPGVGSNIVDKLLNYTILTPMSVIEWALVDNLERGQLLTRAHIYEMIASTMNKVTNRVRQIVAARTQRDLPAVQIALLDETLEKERTEMKRLFEVVEDSLKLVAEGSTDAMMASQNGDTEGETLLRSWGRRWLRVFRRKLTVEEAWVSEMLAEKSGAWPEAQGNGHASGHSEVLEASVADEMDAIS